MCMKLVLNRAKLGNHGILKQQKWFRRIGWLQEAYVVNVKKSKPAKKIQKALADFRVCACMGKNKSTSRRNSCTTWINIGAISLIPFFAAEEVSWIVLDISIAALHSRDHRATRRISSTLQCSAGTHPTTMKNSIQPLLEHGRTISIQIYVL